MTYFKSLFINFLTVFFVNHVMPGITISYHSKLPHIGGELIFAFALGFFNSLVYPVLRVVSKKPSYFKIGISTFVITFGLFAVVNFLPADIKLHTFGAYIWSSLVVWFFAYVTNHMELRRYRLRKMHVKEPTEDEE
jgi:uncharacterized membrane protein YvlD (DUF360 family)